jgi:hypothetical protein
MQDVRVRALASTVVDISAVKRLAPSESDGAPKRKNGKKGKKEEKRGRIYFSEGDRNKSVPFLQFIPAFDRV